jgi:hypothetical protein
MAKAFNLKSEEIVLAGTTVPVIFLGRKGVNEFETIVQVAEGDFLEEGLTITGKPCLVPATGVPVHKSRGYILRIDTSESPSSVGHDYRWSSSPNFVEAHKLKSVTVIARGVKSFGSDSKSEPSDDILLSTTDNTLLKVTPFGKEVYFLWLSREGVFCLNPGEAALASDVIPYFPWDISADSFKPI